MGLIPSYNKTIIYNDDGFNTLSNTREKVRTDRRYTAIENFFSYIDDLNGCAHIFVLCVNTSMRLIYPTSVGTMLNSRQNGIAGYNAEWFVRNNYDIIVESAKRAHYNNLQFYISFRMNDQHANPELKDAFWWKNPFYRAGFFNFGLNWKLPQVRNHYYQIIQETIDKYGECIDGVELDFMRLPTSYGTVTNANQFVQDVSILTKGKGIKLTARVPRHYNRCLGVGLDPAAWNTANSIDSITTSRSYYNNEMFPNIKSFKEKIQNIPIYVDCQYVSTLLGLVKNITRVTETDADGIYFFNFFVGRPKKEPFFYVLNELKNGA